MSFVWSSSKFHVDDIFIGFGLGLLFGLGALCSGMVTPTPSPPPKRYITLTSVVPLGEINGFKIVEQYYRSGRHHYTLECSN